MPSLSYASKTLCPLQDRAAAHTNSIIDSLPLHKLKSSGFFRQKHEYELVYFYPPAKTFVPLTFEEVFMNNLSQRLQKKSIGMYIHIPFCTGRCHFCHYVRYTKPESRIVDQYMEALNRELKMLLAVLSSEDLEITNLHIGGGTPTFLNNTHMTNLMKFVNGKFKVTENAEITCECSPETVIGRHHGKLHNLLQNGVNRINIGIQTFDDRLLTICGRRYSAQHAEDAVQLARAIGFANINVDLIYGLPTQSMYDWQSTLDKIEQLRPESVTVYHLRIHPNSHFAEYSSEDFPSEDVCLVMQIYSYERLRSLGYIQVQPDQFVLPGRSVHHYVIDKWGTDCEFLGVGVSAYGYINGCVYVNRRGMSLYMDSVYGGMLPVSLGKSLSLRQKMSKKVILGLKILPDGVSQEDFTREFGMTIKAAFGDTLSNLERLGLVELSPTSLRLTPTGILFADEVGVAFYTETERTQLDQMSATRYGSYLDLRHESVLDEMSRRAKFICL